MSVRKFDKTFLNARKEAWIILAAWVVCLLWTVGYSWVAGYSQHGETIHLILGIPAWVVWGVLAPWIGATLFSVIFALFYMSDDVLDV